MKKLFKAGATIYSYTDGSAKAPNPGKAGVGVTFTTGSSSPAVKKDEMVQGTLDLPLSY